jgi:hypothetical protein
MKRYLPIPAAANLLPAGKDTEASKAWENKFGKVKVN